MDKKVSLLFKDDVIACNAQKLVKGKELYQLRHLEDEKYVIKHFDMLVYTGNLNNYLKENDITLCYIVDEGDTTLKGKCLNYIKEYGQDEKNELTKIFDGYTKKKIRQKRGFA